MPKSAPLGSVDAFVGGAKRMEGAQPTTVGCGITPDPIRGAPSDSLFDDHDMGGSGRDGGG